MPVEDHPYAVGFGLAGFAVVLLIVLTVGHFAFRWFTADVKGQLQAREQILSGDFRIVAYDHFFDACASVQAIEGSIDATLNEVAATTNPDDLSRLRSNLTGQQATRARSIAQYNADARKSYTIGQFKASDLPYQLPTDDHQKGERTSCEAY